MAITGTSAAFSMTKISHLPVPPASPPRTQMLVSAAKATQERWVGSLSVKAKFGSSKGGAGLLERPPAFDQSQFDPAPKVQEGGDRGQLKYNRGIGRGDGYRVLLIDDVSHTENLVAKVLPQAVPSVTPDDARNLFHESKENGVAVVIVAVKEHAEFYAEMMVRGGLRSTIEPESNAA